MDKLPQRDPELVEAIIAAVRAAIIAEDTGDVPMSPDVPRLERLRDLIAKLDEQRLERLSEQLAKLDDQST